MYSIQSKATIINAEQLESICGKSVLPGELTGFLVLDHRMVIKYVDSLCRSINTTEGTMDGN